MSRSLACRRASLFCVLAACLALLAGDLATAGGAPVNVAGTVWSLLGKNKGSLSKIDKWSNPSDLVLVAFGPLAVGDVIIPEGVFIAGTMNLDNVIAGDYTDDGKGKLTFTLYQDYLEGFIEELFEASIDDVYLDIQTILFTSAKASAKAKAGKTGDVLKAKFSVKFIATGTADGFPGSAKGAFSFSGAGMESQ